MINSAYHFFPNYCYQIFSVSKSCILNILKNLENYYNFNILLLVIFQNFQANFEIKNYYINQNCLTELRLQI